MAFLDKALQMGKKFGETTATVAKSAALAAKEKSEQAIEIGKLKKDIAVENGKISKLYSQIGKYAYELYCGDSDFKVLEPMFLQISDSLAKIEELNEKIEEVKAGDEDLSTLTEQYAEKRRRRKKFHRLKRNRKSLRSRSSQRNRRPSRRNRRYLFWDSRADILKGKEYACDTS